MNTTIINKQSDFKIDVLIPSSVEEKIRYLCGIVHDTEWSGILFYKPQGNIEDKTFHIECVDILPMDVGSHTYTEFNDTSADIINYQVDKPELLEPSIHEALIHSHSTFQSYFSGTDVDTLLAEGNNRNHFFSLIVNNAGQYVARFTRKLLVHNKVDYKVTSSTSYKTYGDKEIVLSKNKVSKNTEENDSCIIEWFDCNITIDKNPDSMFNSVNNRVLQIKQTKQTKRTPLSEAFSNKTPQTLDDYVQQAQSFNHAIENKLFDDTIYQSTSLSDMKQNSITQSKIHDIACQLLTGNIVINSAKIDLNVFMKHADIIYQRRFNDYTSLSLWVSLIVEFVICAFDDTSTVAQKTIDYISSLEQEAEIKTLVLQELSLYL